MAEDKKVILDEVFKRLDEFEKTVSQLHENIKAFRNKLDENIKKYGADITKWPKGQDELDY